ncbi:hypothetical protein BY996DRAFT_6570364 [Phakopsora pachyrhizi]|nr:hypothetical protein BY996DRAFT_6570364 [Phakopsora pachyrhizi]
MIEIVKALGWMEWQQFGTRMLKLNIFVEPYEDEVDEFDDWRNNLSKLRGGHLDDNEDDEAKDQQKEGKFVARAESPKLYEDFCENLWGIFGLHSSREETLEGLGITHGRASHQDYQKK